MIFDKRFYPTFWTQFLGAFNDNVFKNALVILITYKSYSLGSINPEQMVALCSAIFILPFFLFSSLAGQISDKFNKSKLIKIIKFVEILIMLLAAFSFYISNIELLVASLFFMGTQSAFFGPVKYSIIPELVNGQELATANGLFSMGTFVSILLGTIFGGALIAIEPFGENITAIAIVLNAVVGFIMSLKIRSISNETNKQFKLNFNIISTNSELVKIARKSKTVFMSVLGISWYWLIGAILLSIFPVLSKNIINGDESVTTFFLGLFSVGVALGSVVCGKVSKTNFDYGLIVFGSFGISIFCILAFVFPVDNFVKQVSFINYLYSFKSICFSLILFLISFFSGLFIVPLYTLLQRDSEDHERSRVIAANNVLNALFMVIGSIFLALLYEVGLTAKAVFIVLGIGNLVVSYLFYKKYSVSFWRLFCELLSRIFYKFSSNGEVKIEGAYIIIANHVSFIDWMFIAASVKRGPSFVMWYVFFKMPIINIFFKGAKAIPIAGYKEDRKVMLQAFESVDEKLKENCPIAYFPEGVITRDGKMDSFKAGLEKIIEKNNVKIIPIHLSGLWGSFFSRYRGSACSSLKDLIFEFRRPVHVEIGDAFDFISLEDCKERVEALNKDRA